ncbi:O-antigen ligase [uncultured Formosa sp.]|uniref:O-antigen ligase family protein n=1 Tax=uncultured Formosa sp. TaxID=255435 RepID=UPI002613CCA2|nr:O-antigen ligase family protein [uncultured Formosa sp.]
MELMPILNLFNYFPFTKAHIDWTTNRMSSVSFESPALATYLISIAGWMFSYVLTEKGIKRFIPMFLTIILSFLSGSRAGIFVIVIQVLILGMYLMKDKKFKKLFINIFLISLVLGTLMMLFYSKPIIGYVSSKVMSFKTSDDVHAMSNKTRFGIQTAMFEVFLNNPLKGTGYGLQAFESSKLYPEWAVKGNWEFRLKYLNDKHKSFPPGFNLYLRLLAETGVIGFILFMFLIVIIFSWCYKKTFKRQGLQSVIPLMITISMVGFIFNWLKMDTFRIYFFWLCLTLIILIQRQGTRDKRKENNSFNTPLQ